MKKLLILLGIALIIFIGLLSFLYIDKKIKPSKLYVLDGLSDAESCSLNLKTFNEQKFILTKRDTVMKISDIWQEVQLAYSLAYHEIEVTNDFLIYTVDEPVFNKEFILELDRVYKDHIYQFVQTKPTKFTETEINNFKEEFNKIDLEEMQKILSANCSKYKLNLR